MRPTLEERFWAKVDKRGDDECWMWTSTCNWRGYGRFWIGYDRFAAHRIAWGLHYGEPPPADLDVCHHCDNPGCVNPHHLFLGTARDNMQDASRKGRLIPHNKGRTHCPQGHALEGDNLYVCPRGHRYCRTCQRERQRRYRAEGRAWTK